MLGTYSNYHKIYHAEIKISGKGGCVLNLLAVYNPKENNAGLCCYELESVISKGLNNVIILGDLNWNILRNTADVELYIDQFESYGYIIYNI